VGEEEEESRVASAVVFLAVAAIPAVEGGDSEVVMKAAEVVSMVVKEAMAAAVTLEAPLEADEVVPGEGAVEGATMAVAAAEVFLVALKEAEETAETLALVGKAVAEEEMEVLRDPKCSSTRRQPTHRSRQYHLCRCLAGMPTVLSKCS